MSNAAYQDLCEYYMEQVQELTTQELFEEAAEYAESAALPDGLLSEIYVWLGAGAGLPDERDCDMAESDVLNDVAQIARLNRKMVPTAVYEPLLFWLVDQKVAESSL